MGESRTELLQWLNELLAINYTKIEQCGTGAAYCQIFDSIYGDLPMSRVKFAAKHEYESLANFKILQNVFKAKKVDKDPSTILDEALEHLLHTTADLALQPILVEKLTKCKMQDNLEFLQWAKRFWDQNYSGQQYDAVARRKGQAGEPPATLAPVGPSTSRAAVGSMHSGGSASGAAPRGKTPVGSARVTQTNVELLALQTHVGELTAQMEGLEKERDFYFAKLRDIEILVQQELESPDHQAGKEDEVLKEIQKILYSTEEGFEVPEAAAEDETF